MKKLIFLLAMAFVTSLNAQVITMKSQYGNTSDTVTNGATKYMTSGAINVKLSCLTVQVDLTEISGTTAGTINLQYSLDGSTWFTLAADPTYSPADVSSQTFGYKIVGPNTIKYIRIKYTGSGTMSDRLVVKVWGSQ